MVERQKKGGGKKKEKGTAEVSKQKSILEMFAPRAAKTPPTLITLESSPELLDTPPGSSQPPPTSIVDSNYHSGNIATQNETLLWTESDSLKRVQALPPPNEPQTPSTSSIALQDTETTSNQKLPSAAIPLIQEKGGLARSSPIVIDLTSVKESTSKSLPKRGVVHSFFTPKGNTTKQKGPQNPHYLKSGLPVPYPDCVSQHVRGPQTSVPASSSDVPARLTTPPISAPETYEDSGYGFLIPGLHSPYSTPNRTVTLVPHIADGSSLSKYASAIPTEHFIRYPSISRMVDRSVSCTLPQAPAGRTLAEKWRPRCAEEVLGNETSAQYLRDWLRALELQLEDSCSHRVPVPEGSARAKEKPVLDKSRKRPRVITEVPRARYRKRAKTESDEEDNSWIVDDDEEDEGEAYSSSHYTPDFDADAQLPSSSPIPSTASLPDSGSQAFANPLSDVPQDLGKLHNTILLVGPPGSGKTASVYACAEELGWEVFEVYPGIGKRSGASLENLVGEVGKNHLVRQRPHGRHDFVTFSSPSKLKRKQGLNSWLKSDPDSEYDRSSVPLTEPDIEDSVQDRTASLVQSLILLEEVDILFKEDSRFWDTVKSVIRDCKRPVVCTCNDVSLVPLDDLPIQRVLNFDACPSDTLTSYLHAICLAEGRSVDRVDLDKCIVSASREGHEESQRSAGHVYDLRRAINTLDLSLTGGFPQARSETVPSGPTLVSEPASRFGFGAGSDSAHEILGQLKKAVYVADIASFVDSELGRNELDRPAEIEIESLGPTGDDEMGHPILLDTRLEASLPSTYRRDIEIGTIIRDRMGPNESQGLVADIRRHYEDVFRDVCPPSVVWMGQSTLFTDYAPFIKQVAEAEEAQAAMLLQQAQQRKGRQTRNSALSSYYRTLNFSDQGREGLAAICFRE